MLKRPQGWDSVETPPPWDQQGVPAGPGANTGLQAASWTLQLGGWGSTGFGFGGEKERERETAWDERGGGGRHEKKAGESDG